MKGLSIILSALLMISALTGCGSDSPNAPASGAEAASSGNQQSVAPSGTGASEPAPAPEADFITYDVDGFYSIEVPKDLKSEIGGLRNEKVNVYSPDGTWFLYFNPEEGGLAEYDAQKQLSQGNDTFAPITVGGQEGFRVYNSMRGEVFVYFPFGLIQLGDDFQSGAEKIAAYLDDPIVQALLASVKLSNQADVVAAPFNAVAWQELFASEIEAQNGKYQMSDEPTEREGNLVYGLRFEDAPYAGGRVTVYQDGTGAAEYFIGFIAMEDCAIESYAALALWCAGVTDTALTVALENLGINSFSLAEGETGSYEAAGLKVTSQWVSNGFAIRFEPK